MTEADLGRLARQIGSRLKQAGKRLVAAESCTGGLVAATLTEIPGASDWFEGSFVVYRPSAKRAMLNVPACIIDREGVVSEPTVRAMAEGALDEAHAAHISVAITGIAGPEGGQPESPVGTVWFGWATSEGKGRNIRCAQTSMHHLQGDRRRVRFEAVRIALEGVGRLLPGSAR